MVRPFFTRDRISGFDIFSRHADELIAKLKERVHSGKVFDFQDATACFTLDSATEYLVGKSVNSLSEPFAISPSTEVNESSSSNLSNASASVAFATAFGSAQHIIANRTRIGAIWYLFEIRKDKTDDPMRVIKAYLDPILNDALQRAQGRSGLDTMEKGQGKDEVEGRETFLCHMMK